MWFSNDSELLLFVRILLVFYRSGYCVMKSIDQFNLRMVLFIFILYHLILRKRAVYHTNNTACQA